MDPPKGVWRQSLSPYESEQVITNLLDLDRWPSWHSSAGRILSEKTGALGEGQRFDLHRIERQRLIEDMWSVKSIRSSEAPRFLEIEFLWQGQQREGKPLGTALSNLSMTVTVWAEEGGGVEIASWWDVPWWAKFMKGRVNRLPRAMAKQWLKDACSGATLPILPSQEAFLNESE
ncbi:MAG: hypothetical protein L7S46_06570 [Candidatus Poseidoniaceae archaeon]|nr:hypothetical protein [Candidatus Poseidoniaceae archaeon]